MTNSARPPRFTRRTLLAASAGVAIGACAGSDSTAEPETTTTEAPTSADGDSTLPSTTTTTTIPELADAPAYSGTDPFRLGVASGDPDSTSVVLWTRLLPEDAAGDFDAADQDVAWEMSSTLDFDTVVAAGTTVAPARYAHSVHLIVDGLEVDSWYYYRFRVGDFTSTVGRARTCPAPSSTDELTFGFSSCQSWETGAYAAHRAAADMDDLDLFVWLGDYIYEYGPNPQAVETEAAGLRVHNSEEVVTLDEYRARYALYRSDPHLQASHAARPWVVTWDDHEVDNNYNGPNASDAQSIEEFEARQISAHQAWWEHMPVRLDPPDGARLQIHRTVRWGELVDLHMLDGRQYRDPRPTDGEPVDLPGGAAGFGVENLGPTALDPDHSMLGADQEAWLIEEIGASNARWTVLGNQVYMHGITAFPGAEPVINTDTWDGFFGNRERLLGQIDDAKSGDLVVLSGDFHSSTAAALRTDPFDLEQPIIGTEFMAPAVSSQFPEGLKDLIPFALVINPQVAAFDFRNGLMVCTVNEDSWVAERLNVADHRDETSDVATTARFTVRPGAPGDIDVDDLEPATA